MNRLRTPRWWLVTTFAFPILGNYVLWAFIVPAGMGL